MILSGYLLCVNLTYDTNALDSNITQYETPKTISFNKKAYIIQIILHNVLKYKKFLKYYHSSVS